MYLEIIPEDILLIIISKLEYKEFITIINLLNIKPDNNPFFKKLVILKFRIIPKYNYNWYSIYTQSLYEKSENIYENRITPELDQFLYKEKLYSPNKVYKFLPGLAKLPDYNSVNEILDYSIKKYNHLKFDPDFNYVNLNMRQLNPRQPKINQKQLKINKYFESLAEIMLGVNLDISKKFEIIDKIILYTDTIIEYDYIFIRYFNNIKEINNTNIPIINKIMAYSDFDTYDMPQYIKNFNILKELINRYNLNYDVSMIISHFSEYPTLKALKYIFDNYTIEEIAHYQNMEGILSGIIEYTKNNERNKNTFDTIQTMIYYYSKLPQEDLSGHIIED
jgi:hypothetical protein